MEKYYNAPCFIINLERRPDRLQTSCFRVNQVGYKNIYRFEAVDGQDENQLKKEWANLNNPKINEKDELFLINKGRQGCALTHIKLWKYIIDNNIEFATVFEDDIIFHKEWFTRSEEYMKSTPTNFDILYLGCYLDYMIQAYIYTAPVYCTHAYIITLEGAKKFLNLILNNPDGIYTIDVMIINLMQNYLCFDTMAKKEPPFIWYIWNGDIFPYENYPGITLGRISDEFYKRKHSGIVFQDDECGSDIV